MKAWGLERFGLGNLQLSTLELPERKSGELLVRVNAVSLNYRDRLVVEGQLLPSLPSMPFVPVSDFAGEVVSVGTGVTRFAAGDRVMGNFWTQWTNGQAPDDFEQNVSSLGGPLQGALAEFIVIPESAAVATPRNLTDVEASTLPVAALTAWFALTESAETTADQTILVQGTGGVALATVQIATALGAKVIVTSRSAEKLSRVRKLGVSTVIDTSVERNWSVAAREATNGRGVDHVLEIIGGENFAQSMEALAPGGQISVIGFLGGFDMQLNAVPLMLRRARVQGVSVGHRASFERLARFIEERDIHPIVEIIYGFDDAPKAFDHLATGPFGKVVMDLRQ